MREKEKMYSFSSYGFHKGFYNYDNFEDALHNVDYADFFVYSDDEEFPYDSAHQLLYGSCHHFAMALKEILGYNAYIIEGNNKKGFHAFCQIYDRIKKQWYYIDARGITTSFDEFMEVAKSFVSDEYTIRQVSPKDIAEWESDDYYNEEGYGFAKAVVEKYKDYYTL